MEVLIAAGILSVMSIGLMKTFEVSVNSANLMNSLYVTQDLRTVVTKTLNSGLQCENNLKNSNLVSYTGAGDTRKVEVLKKFRSAVDTTGTELIRSGERFRDYLDIVAMRLEEPDADLVFNNDIHKTFSVYYKLGRVRKFRTRDERPCTETDLSGCYVNKCNLEYDWRDPMNPKCNLLDCFSESDKRVSVAGMRCSDNQYLSGYDSNGRAECKDLPVCEDDEYFRGFDSSGDKICEKTHRDQSCDRDTEYLVGFDSHGDKICVSKSQQVQTPPPSSPPPSPQPPPSPPPPSPPPPQQAEKFIRYDCNKGYFTTSVSGNKKYRYTYKITMTCSGSFPNYYVDAYESYRDGSTPCGRSGSSSKTIFGVVDYAPNTRTGNNPDETRCTGDVLRKAHNNARNRCSNFGRGGTYNQSTKTCTGE